MYPPPRHRQLSRLALLLVLVSCGRGQTRDQADFWQEALPPPIALLDPPLLAPLRGRVSDEAVAARVIDITRFVAGPDEAVGADWTVRLVDTMGLERRLFLRLAPGTTLPLFRNETIVVRTFSRLMDDGSVQRNLIVSARRPLGTGADFKAVLVIARFEELFSADALPKLLTGISRSEQVAFREARKGDGDCALTTTHYQVNVGTDARASGLRHKQLFAPGAHVRRQERDVAYDVTIHDASRTSQAPCPLPDEVTLVWSAVWVDDTAKPAPKSTGVAMEAAVLPLAATPTTPLGSKPPPRKPRKANNHEPVLRQ